MSEAIELEFIDPPSRTLVVDGETIVITPLLTKEMPKVVRAIDPALQALIYGAEGLDVPRMIGMLGEHGEAIAEAVAICIRKPREWVDNRLPDRTAVLALAAIEVNQDFFARVEMGLRGQAQAVAPTLAAKIMAKPWPGTTPSTA